MKHPGIYTGGSHASGRDVHVEVIDNEGKVIDSVRTEGQEYHICSDSLDDKQVLDFKNKKNVDVLTYIFNNNSCEFHQGIAKEGDFIVRKSAVLDDNQYDRHGTAKQIINEMQSEKGGRLAMQRGGQLQEGGKIGKKDNVVLADGYVAGVEAGQFVYRGVFYAMYRVMIPNTSKKNHPKEKYRYKISGEQYSGLYGLNKAVNKVEAEIDEYLKSEESESKPEDYLAKGGKINKQTEYEPGSLIERGIHKDIPYSIRKGEDKYILRIYWPDGQIYLEGFYALTMPKAMSKVYIDKYLKDNQPKPEDYLAEGGKVSRNKFFGEYSHNGVKYDIYGWKENELWMYYYKCDIVPGFDLWDGSHYESVGEAGRDAEAAIDAYIEQHKEPAAEDYLAQGGNIKTTPTNTEVKKETTIHQPTFEKIKHGEIKTPEDLGKSLEADHKKDASMSQVKVLPVQIAVYVPSAKNVDEVASKGEFASRVSEVEQYLASVFGGFSSEDEQGGYMDNAQELVKENVVKVEAFPKEEDWNNNNQELITQIGKWSKAWGQEAVGLEYNNTLLYVPENVRVDWNELKEYQEGVEVKTSPIILTKAKKRPHSKIKPTKKFEAGGLFTQDKKLKCIVKSDWFSDVDGGVFIKSPTGKEVKISRKDFDWSKITPEQASVFGGLLHKQPAEEQWLTLKELNTFYDIAKQTYPDKYKEEGGFISEQKPRENTSAIITQVITNLPKYKDLTYQEAETLYNQFNDLTKLKKTTEEEFYIECPLVDKSSYTPEYYLYLGLEKKGYGYLIGETFTAKDKTFEFIHAIRERIGKSDTDVANITQEELSGDFNSKGYAAGGSFKNNQKITSLILPISQSYHVSEEIYRGITYQTRYKTSGYNPGYFVVQPKAIDESDIVIEGLFSTEPDNMYYPSKQLSSDYARKAIDDYLDSAPENYLAKGGSVNRKKYSLQQVKYIINNEGLFYAVSSYMDGSEIANTKLSKQWMECYQLIETLQHFVNTYPKYGEFCRKVKEEGIGYVIMKYDVDDDIYDGIPPLIKRQVGQVQTILEDIRIRFGIEKWQASEPEDYLAKGGSVNLVDKKQHLINKYRWKKGDEILYRNVYFTVYQERGQYNTAYFYVITLLVSESVLFDNKVDAVKSAKEEIDKYLKNNPSSEEYLAKGGKIKTPNKAEIINTYTYKGVPYKIACLRKGRAHHGIATQDVNFKYFARVYIDKSYEDTKMFNYQSSANEAAKKTIDKWIKGPKPEDYLEQGGNIKKTGANYKSAPVTLPPLESKLSNSTKLPSPDIETIDNEPGESKGKYTDYLYMAGGVIRRIYEDTHTGVFRDKIISVLSNDPYYNQEDVPTIADGIINVDDIILQYDPTNPIITKLNEAVYFFPDSRQVVRDKDLMVSYIKYAAHFVTQDTKNGRSNDSSKQDAVHLIVDVLKNKDPERYRDKNSGSIMYVFRDIVVKRLFVTALRIETNGIGQLRFVTFMPNRKEISANWELAPISIPRSDSRLQPQIGTIREDDLLSSEHSESKDKTTTKNNTNDIKNDENSENIDNQHDNFEQGGLIARKKHAITTLANNVQSLKVNIAKDLKSEKEKVRLNALVIAIMLKTGERIGNDDSASIAGHFGVTGLRKKHIKISGDFVQLDYVGKSGVEHDTGFTDSVIAENLRWAIKNSPSRNVFTTSTGFKISASKINRYLKEYGITAKDIRGFTANKLIIDKLKLADISKEENERKKKFNEVLKSVSKKIGHGRATLKNHYLMPQVEEEYVAEGKIYNIKQNE